MKYKIVFAASILLILLAYLYTLATPPKEYPGELIRLDSSVVVKGSVFTNGQWVSVGKVTLPKEYVAGPFHVK